MFCWGDDNCDPSTIQYLKDLGMHGIIYDKIYQYIEKEKEDSIYLLDVRDSQKDIIRMMAQTAEGAGMPASASYVAETTEKLLQDQMDADVDRVSTATTLASLESDVEAFGKLEM